MSRRKEEESRNPSAAVGKGDTRQTTASGRTGSISRSGTGGSRILCLVAERGKEKEARTERARLITAIRLWTRAEHRVEDETR